MAMGLWNNRMPYHLRLFAWLLGYSILLATCFVLFQYHREKQFKAAELNAGLQPVNRYILTEIANGVPAAGIGTGDLHPFKDLRVSVIDSTGRVIYDTSPDTITYGNHLDREEIRQALRTGSGYTVRRHSLSTGDTYFYSAASGGGYIVRTAVPYSVTLSGLLRADYGFLWFMGAAAAAMCLIGYFATRREGEVISRLNRFARRAERGERITGTEPFPHGELGDISGHIVRLYARLQQATADRDREHKAALHEQQEKERIKKQLTNNINHELKTPVASIQACVETLLTHRALPEAKREEFLQRCLTNTCRLRQLLDDVSLITRMDDGGGAITMERVDLADIIADVAADCRQRAEARGITIRDHIAAPVPVDGNAPLLASVFHNLIDNAISYSGGTAVDIRCERPTSDSITLTVTDDGNGVPSEHLPRLFERFYRIDKGRSRAAGGTGLGLAIVKNAVMLHGGHIAVRNLSTGGLRFTITLPCT